MTSTPPPVRDGLLRGGRTAQRAPAGERTTAPRNMTREGRSWRDAALVGLTMMTAYTTAISWQAQAVSYPLFRAVGADRFAAYHQQYNHDILWPVLIPGFSTVIACALFIWIRPAGVRRPLAAVVTATGIVSLLLTMFWAIPMHDRLDEQGPVASTIDSLLQANLLRSVVLSVCTVLLGWVVLSNHRSAASQVDN